MTKEEFAQLQGVVKQRDELRAENERLDERVAELEELHRQASQNLLSANQSIQDSIERIGELEEDYKNMEGCAVALRERNKELERQGDENK